MSHRRIQTQMLPVGLEWDSNMRQAGSFEWEVFSFPEPENQFGFFLLNPSISNGRLVFILLFGAILFLKLAQAENQVNKRIQYGHQDIRLNKNYTEVRTNLKPSCDLFTTWRNTLFKWHGHSRCIFSDLGRTALEMWCFLHAWGEVKYVTKHPKKIIENIFFNILSLVWKVVEQKTLVQILTRFCMCLMGSVRYNPTRRYLSVLITHWCTVY